MTRGKGPSPQDRIRQADVGELAAALTHLRQGVVEAASLRQAREAMGLTQGDLGGLLGFSTETLCKRERGRLPFKYADALAIEALLVRALDGRDGADPFASAVAALAAENLRDPLGRRLAALCVEHGVGPAGAGKGGGA